MGGYCRSRSIPGCRWRGWWETLSGMVLRQDSLYCGTLNMVDVEQSVVGGLPVASSKPLGCRAEAAHHCVTGGVLSGG